MDHALTEKERHERASSARQPSPGRPALGLPPGQCAVEGFPRFGTHFHRPPPAVPPAPAVEVTGVITTPLVIGIADLATLPRREMMADFHCVAGWSATGLRWEGVPFAAFYRTMIEPSLLPGAVVTHVSFFGLDGYRSIVTIEDAMNDDVLLAERLDGEPLTSDHGAPLRLVSPSQYGFISTKHLSQIEVHAGSPPERYHRSALIQLGLDLVKPHPRARVWEEERHRYLAPRWVRTVYRSLIPPFRALSDRGR